MAGALLFQSKVPLIFWGECVLTAAHLINRVTIPMLNNKAPYDILFEKDVDCCSLRTFGCLAYASTLSVHRSKLDPRARPCIFMGYPVGVKGYKLYDVTKKKFFISPDVLFFEHLFPFSTLKDTDFTLDNTTFLENFVAPCSFSDADVHIMRCVPVIIADIATDMEQQQPNNQEPTSSPAVLFNFNPARRGGSRK